MRVLKVKTGSEEQTQALAEKLAGQFHNGDVVVLTGPLGSGKTEFVRGLAKARGVGHDRVNSPSYTFVNEYPGENPVYHFDLYRLGDTDELYEIGWDEYLGRNGLIVVEWGERAKGLLPEKYYQLEFVILNDTDREIDITLVAP